MLICSLRWRRGWRRGRRSTISSQLKHDRVSTSRDRSPTHHSQLGRHTLAKTKIMSQERKMFETYVSSCYEIPILSCIRLIKQAERIKLIARRTILCKACVFIYVRRNARKNMQRSSTAKAFITKDCDMLLIQDCIEGTKFTVRPLSTILLFV